MASLGQMILFFEKVSVAFFHQCQKHLVEDKLLTYLLHFLDDTFWMVDVFLKLSYSVQVKIVVKKKEFKN